MLYYLFRYLEQTFGNVPGGGLFTFITFRAAIAFLLSIIISLVFGKAMINKLRKLQVGEDIRDLGLQGQMEKKGTPTMGGFLILAGIVIPTLLVARLGSVYIWLILLSTILFGAIGFIDDYIKVFLKNKKGLAGKFKIIGQVGIGLIVGATLYFHPDVRMRETVAKADVEEERQHIVSPKHSPEVLHKVTRGGEEYWVVDHKSAKTTIPFVKNNEFDYAQILTWLDESYDRYAWLVYIPIVILIITAVSNGANITDGLDGLAAGVSAPIVFTLGIFAYVSGHSIIAEYLNIMYIPNLGELMVYSSALIGACVGFLWFNVYPAQVFMGDTGSLTLGGVISVLAIMVRKELLIPVLCGVFLIENLSIMVQVSYFKYTKRKYGEGRRILLMSPLHHHYQKLGYHESKIVARFWIVSVFLAILTIITLKVR